MPKNNRRCRFRDIRRGQQFRTMRNGYWVMAVRTKLFTLQHGKPRRRNVVLIGDGPEAGHPILIDGDAIVERM